MPKIKIKFVGMTLVEVMISIVIMLIAIAGFSLLFIKSWHMNSYAVEMGQSSFAVSQGVNTMVGYLRKVRQGDDGSYPIISASDNDLVVYSDYNRDGITERLHFYLQGNQIKLGITSPTNGMPKSYPAGDQITQILASSIVNTASEHLFSYYDTNYPADTVNNPVATPVGVSSVRLIKIFLKINIDPNKAPDNIQTESFVELRNLNDYDRIK